jgi:hypothetical protein
MEREIVICAGSGLYHPNHTHYPMHLDPALLHSLAEKVGTPFWLYSAGTLRQRISEIKQVTAARDELLAYRGIDLDAGETELPDDAGSA